MITLVVYLRFHLLQINLYLTQTTVSNIINTIFHYNTALAFKSQPWWDGNICSFPFKPNTG